MNLHELYELSVQLLASLDECIEMSGQVQGEQQCPQAGFVFEELAEVHTSCITNTYVYSHLYIGYHCIEYVYGIAYIHVCI